MLGYGCKHCSAEFCKLHRLPEDHSCSVNFIELGRKRIKMENPVVSTKKIEDI
jgi:predicted nucleic acid binding AN1-type Zn finger protein